MTSKPKDPLLLAESAVIYVEFDSWTGAPKRVNGTVEVRQKSATDHNRVIHFKPGVTGHEAYNLDSFIKGIDKYEACLLYTSPSPRDS